MVMASRLYAGEIRTMLVARQSRRREEESLWTRMTGTLAVQTDTTALQRELNDKQVCVVKRP